MTGEGDAVDPASLPVISVQSAADPPSGEEVEGWLGKVLSVYVTPTPRPGPIGWGEFFRFARATRIERIAWWRRKRCPRCEQSRRYAISVEWESGYTEPEAQPVVCEACVFGCVVSGAEWISFDGGEEGDARVEWSVKL